MSSPFRQQRSFPCRIPVRISRNYSKLPPITPSIHSIDDENRSTKTTNTPRSVDQINLSRQPTPIVNSTEYNNFKSSLSIDSTDIDHEISPKDVSEFWTKLRQHISKETSKNSDNHGCQQTPNKVVRIFVSSTFTDFFNEREVLIKQVFPELRDELEPVGLQIIDCDLRWGVPKDSTTEQTILTCLEELDRCFEDNGQPFFIGLVSDKYGWVPKINDLPKNITERYRWIDGASITLMEFIHGAFRTHNPNAFFLIRNSENVLKNLPEKYLDRFRDKDELSQKQIQELKQQLSDIVPAEHIFNYDCFYNGLDSTSGRERVNIDGLQDFGAKVKSFLSEAINKWYPENFDSESSSNAEQKQMTTFLLNKTQFFVDRPEEFSALVKYVTGVHDDFTLLYRKVSHPEGHPPMLAIRGQAGDGKTMLLGKFVLHIEEKMKDKFLLFYHFLDGAFHPNASHFMYNALVKKLDKYLEDNNLQYSEAGERLLTTSETFLPRAIELLSIPLVIIIDGLDKGDIHQQRKYCNEFPFSSYRDLRSDHTYIVLSCENESALWQEIDSYYHYELELKPLTNEQCSLYIEGFFTRFNKINTK
ncbi:unnamed protein product [Adineta steineri]|uniref:Uncharacterized protein n=1 Tax=Adineta steineri TaxID=433720 RepID=A0A813SX05_9BILA|nr:unnamed protein product [Adineta steineri]CAF3520568.1 unnamed protein product [Adineta steineri]CAF3821573.1 unnamed protein product [Adineta steineri]